MITVDDVLAWDAWASEAPEAEREARVQRVRLALFPPGLTEIELGRREWLLKRAEDLPEDERRAEPRPPPEPTPAASVPATSTAPALTLAEAARLERRKRPWRSTTEEFGAEFAELRAEQAEMLKEARSPFYDREREARIKKQADDAIARLGLGKKRRAK